MVIQPKKPIDIDISKINKRVEELNENRNREQKPYERQKTALEVEHSGFLASLSFAKTLKSATTQDIIKFLVWKDKGGRTKVHTVTCSHMGQGQGSSCKCPCRLAAGTVDSLIGKLRAIFISAGMKRDTPEDCVDSINTLSKAIGNAHKDILFYSALQGDILSTLKEAFSTSFSVLLKNNINISRSHAFFLMKFYKLIDEYPKLLQCEVPLNYFKKNFSMIKTIC